MGFIAGDPVSLSIAESALTNVPIKSMAHAVEQLINCILYCRNQERFRKWGEITLGGSRGN